ncbi:MAG: transposase, partial [Gammaproteobacteria bacterium]
MRRRRSIRLEGYDYAAPGAYFVTICTHGRACLFGEITHGEIKLSVPGEIAAEEWRRTAAIRSEVVLDAFVVMPNHIHAIVWFKHVGATDPVGVQRHNAHPVGAHGGVPDVHADTQRVGAHG